MHLYVCACNKNLGGGQDLHSIFENLSGPVYVDSLPAYQFRSFAHFKFAWIEIAVFLGSLHCGTQREFGGTRSELTAGHDQ